MSASPRSSAASLPDLSALPSAPPPPKTLDKSPRIVSAHMNTERLKVLRLGLAAARARADAGCVVWTRLVHGLASTTRALEEEDALGETVHPHQVRNRQATTSDTSDGGSVEGGAEEAASKVAKLGKVQRVTKRRWTRMGRQLVAARIQQLVANSPRLANAKLELQFPPTESFDLPTAKPTDPLSAEGVTLCPSSNTLARLRCTACGIQLAFRLGQLGATSSSGCLCTKVGEVADPDTQTFAFDLTAYRVSMDATAELENLRLLLKAHRGEGVTITTSLEAFSANRRILQLECGVCHTRVNKPVNKRLVFGSLDCACARPQKRKRDAASSGTNRRRVYPLGMAAMRAQASDNDGVEAK